MENLFAIPLVFGFYNLKDIIMLERLVAVFTHAAPPVVHHNVVTVLLDGNQGTPVPVFLFCFVNDKGN